MGREDVQYCLGFIGRTLVVFHGVRSTSSSNSTNAARVMREIIEAFPTIYTLAINSFERGAPDFRGSVRDLLIRAIPSESSLTKTRNTGLSAVSVLEKEVGYDGRARS